MSRQQLPPPIVRKSSTPWDRLRPVRQDVLESMGYVSKGDNRLLDVKIQESFYQKIVARYMHFCTQHKSDLDAAFASLSSSSDTSTSSDATRNPPVPTTTSTRMQQNSSASVHGLANSKWASSPPPEAAGPPPASELSVILIALRKLREALLATSSTATSPAFSQRVHIFNIRVAILALHPPSYHPSLTYLLTVLHTKKHPLPESEHKEMTGYLVLDLALRQNDLIAAHSLRYDSKAIFKYQDRSIDAVLQAVMANNWVAFWRIRRQVGGYTRAMMHWHINALRTTTLKTFGKAYLKVDSNWVLKSTSGNEMSWDELVKHEAIGWVKEGNTIVIRKPKSATRS